MTLERLGPYQVVRRLGAGGMGTVYEAIDQDAGTRVAVKVLPPAFADNANLRTRFAGEIKTLTSLQHPNIARIYGYGEADGHHFYSMELVDGPSLADFLKEKSRLEWREAVRIGLALCAALKHAHAHGIIHRDLKPANIVLDESGDVKLVDFGIARVFGASQLTSSGSMLGTPNYMAPEQATTEAPITERTDLYSLGCVFYAMLARTPPFHADSAASVIQAHLTKKPVPIRVVAPDTPEDLEKLVMRLLSKNPENRFRTAHAVARRLQAIQENEDSREDADGFPIKQTGQAENSEVAIPSEGDSDCEIETEFTATTDMNLTAARPLLNRGESSRDEDPAIRNEHTFKAIESVDHSITPPPTVSFGKQWFSMLVLLCIGAFCFAIPWQMVKRRNARPVDALFQSIRRAKRPVASHATLAEIQQDIELFRQWYPRHPRAHEVERLAAQLPYYAFVQDLRSRDVTALSGLEKDCREAMKMAESEPGSALDKFRQVIQTDQDLFAQSQRTESSIWCAKLAREEVDRIEGLVDWEFKSINTRKKDESIPFLISQKYAMQTFITKYSNDSRSSELRDQLDELELKIYVSQISERVQEDRSSLAPHDKQFLAAYRESENQPGKALLLFRELASQLSSSENSGECFAATKDQIDKLESQINERHEALEKARNAGVGSLAKHRNDLVFFAEQFSFDDRCDSVRSDLVNVDIHLLDDRMERLVAADRSSLQPVEKLYLDALELSETDPEAAAKSFALLVDLYGPFTSAPSLDGSHECEVCVKSARRKVIEWKQSAELERTVSIQELHRLIDRAEGLYESDVSAAKAMAKAIIDLYGTKPWATESCQRAKELIQEAITR